MKKVVESLKWLLALFATAGLAALAMVAGRRRSLTSAQEEENLKVQEALAAQQKAKEAELAAIAATAQKQQENILAAHQEKLDAIATAAHDQEKALAADPSAASDALGAALDGARKLEPKA